MVIILSFRHSHIIILSSTPRHFSLLYNSLIVADEKQRKEEDSTKESLKFTVSINSNKDLSNH